LELVDSLTDDICPCLFDASVQLLLLTGGMLAAA